MRIDLLAIVAGAGAIAHVYFAYQETIGWGPKFVRKAARAWMPTIRTGQRRI